MWWLFVAWAKFPKAGITYKIFLAFFGKGFFSQLKSLDQITFCIYKSMPGTLNCSQEWNQWGKGPWERGGGKQHDSLLMLIITSTIEDDDELCKKNGVNPAPADGSAPNLVV